MLVFVFAMIAWHLVWSILVSSIISALTYLLLVVPEKVTTSPLPQQKEKMILASQQAQRPRDFNVLVKFNTALRCLSAHRSLKKCVAIDKHTSNGIIDGKLGL